MKKIGITLFAAACVTSVFAQDAAAARAAYQQQQALAEVPRLVQQFEVLANNQDAIVERLTKVEAGGGTDDLRAEIANLKAEIAELKASVRRDQDAMRREIVADLAKRISAMQPPAPPPPPQPAYVPAPRAAAPAPAARPAPVQPAVTGPYYEHVVEAGQTLSFIAKGFDTTVAKILAANPGLKPNNVRVGQKLIIPAEEALKPAPKAPAKKRK